MEGDRNGFCARFGLLLFWKVVRCGRREGAFSTVMEARGKCNGTVSNL